MAASDGQMLDRRDAAEAIAQALEQREAVVAYRGIVDVHHHAVEERIDLRAQAGEAAEHGDVVAAREQRVSLGNRRIDRGGEFALGVLDEPRWIDRARQLAFDLAQDVADALVGRGQRLRFGQARELGDGFQAGVEIRQRRRA